MSRLHTERHNIGRIGWLRASVLGANDGIVSTASLVVGVAAAAARNTPGRIRRSGGGGALMAAGEYVSVSSQADAEAADIARETRERDEAPEAEHCWALWARKPAERACSGEWYEWCSGERWQWPSPPG